MAVAIATTNFKINMTTDFFIVQKYLQTIHAKHDEDYNTNNLSSKVKINYNQTKCQIYFHEYGKYMKQNQDRYNQRNPNGYNCDPHHRRNKR